MNAFSIALNRFGRGARAAGGAAAPGTFAFAPDVQKPGDRTIMGRRYPAAGEAQAVLADPAASPATATRDGRTAPGGLAPLGGDLPTVYRAIVDSPEAWVEAPAKYRTPWQVCLRMSLQL